MVKIPDKLHAAPPVNRKGSPDDVPALATVHREPNTKKVPIQLKISAELARQFRVYCAENDLELSEAFRVLFEEHLRKRGAGK
jgi:hypothetical protein